MTTGRKLGAMAIMTVAVILTGCTTSTAPHQLRPLHHCARPPPATVVAVAKPALESVTSGSFAVNVPAGWTVVSPSADACTEGSGSSEVIAGPMGQALSHCGLPQVSRGTLVVFAHGDPPTAPVLSGQTGLLRVTRVNGQGVFPGEWLHRLLLDERCHRQRMDRECNALELPLGYPRPHLRSACETNAGAVMLAASESPTA